MITELAPAKINLALHVRARRPDGYHEIETLFAFCRDGDRLEIEETRADELRIVGPFAEGLSITDNLVLAALAAMRDQPFGDIPPLAITLTKYLPVAAGIGGGSADAAAMIRLLDRQYGHNGDNKELVLATAHLGADVGACIVGHTRIGIGVGTDLHVASDDLAGCPVLLVNPRVPLSTGAVFNAWDGVDRDPLPQGTAREIALAGRNDLEEPAIRLCPQIAEVLAALQRTDAWLVRMSGSGATCFALFDAEAARSVAYAAITAAQPDWWCLESTLA
ncbi:4-(cytidine 5'-diphospho)-2-C-methyl-D-erythritol kinase [Sphingomonas bacterium]|uniref:4-(cytidine 5'-diphospho)-2-C-methyl-D-erythritol kinase n=1 Tax=Sphingomonas bacterium TaxID=1895847 RepID=UPI002627FBD2|nr:4-(cytidine 5'-diphospho)-2-C-methyl-D-erythritol kinase [Sphingomonas bacterium]MDB5678909.1 4-(cytidine 5-diphospho)-2-C-methyl-D-erythritol kinase [Sphingomonas bacterium]